MMRTTPRSEMRHRLLLIDEAPDIHEFIASAFAADNIEIVSASNADQALALAREAPPDLILLDHGCPDANGLEILSRLRAQSAAEPTPVIFVTANEKHETLAECFQAGAADYIRKPFCTEELRARIHSALERKQMLAQLKQLALRDALTGLDNRTSIRDRIQFALDHLQCNRSALLFLDFDRFKLVNDSLGHDVGDLLLQQIANRLRTALRRADGVAYNPDRTSAARLGGDEFVVFLENLADSQDALRIADRLLVSLAETYRLAGHEVSCTASIGVVAGLSAYRSPDEVLRDADTAMYEAKSTGKGRYVVFDQSMHAKAELRLQMETDLHAAIARDEFFLEFQPIVSLETGRTTGFEAVLRWNHPQRGLILPTEFLPLAEESGLILPIEEWALDRACRELALWRRSIAAADGLSLHVHLSRKQLMLRDLADSVGTVLDNYGLPPELLHLEVTESEIMQNPHVAKGAFRDLRRIGVRIDMDDFGTGHSSLNCLQELPIDVLKVDRSFVAQMERSRSFAALVHAVTGLGRNLGLTVVAEGIETADQLVMLQSMDCELGQGYFFARPLPSGEIETYLRRGSKAVRWTGVSAPIVEELAGVAATPDCMGTQEG